MKPEDAFYFTENHPELLAGALMDEKETEKRII